MGSEWTIVSEIRIQISKNGNTAQLPCNETVFNEGNNGGRSCQFHHDYPKVAPYDYPNYPNYSKSSSVGLPSVMITLKQVARDYPRITLITLITRITLGLP